MVAESATPLSEPWLLQEPKKSHKHTLSDFQRSKLIERYDGRTETINELMPYFAYVPRWQVRKWAQDLGLSRQKEPPWSDEELDYLERNMGKKRVQEISKHLGRTVTAVKLKAKRIGVRKSDDGYTLSALCQGLGCDHHKVAKWVNAGWLRGTRRQTERLEVQGGDMWHFTDRAVFELVRDHPNEIDPRRVAWLWLVDILISHGR